MTDAPLLVVEGLSKYFPVKAGGFTPSGGRMLRAVNDVSFSLARGRTLGLVGESGSGKTTTGRLVLRLIEPSAGIIRLDGEDVLAAKGPQLKALRRKMQIVFQDPQGSLNPRLSVGQLLAEPLYIHGVKSAERERRVGELLRAVELPADAVKRYPHEFSGGQRQRVAIARALALKPALVVADEPVSALDASIQSQILMLFKRLQDESGVAYLFISHDLAVVRFICQMVAVMYFGEIVETGSVDDVYHRPAHPYTRALLAAIPDPAPDQAPVVPLGGHTPDAADPPPGCPFAARCPEALPRCATQDPPRFAVGAGHFARCWLNKPAGAASEEAG